MSFYNDDHDYENGPALAGPAESAHNMTLELNPDSAHLCVASRDEIEEEASGKDQLNCLSFCLRCPPGRRSSIKFSVYKPANGAAIKKTIARPPYQH